MKTRKLGTQHGAAIRNTVSNAAHATLMTVGSAVNAAAGAVTDVGFSVVNYVAAFAQGLLRRPNA
jgi:hypothetical protein